MIFRTLGGGGFHNPHNPQKRLPDPHHARVSQKGGRVEARRKKLWQKANRSGKTYQAAVDPEADSRPRARRSRRPPLGGRWSRDNPGSSWSTQFKELLLPQVPGNQKWGKDGVDLLFPIKVSSETRIEDFERAVPMDAPAAQATFGTDGAHAVLRLAHMLAAGVDPESATAVGVLRAMAPRDTIEAMHMSQAAHATRAGVPTRANVSPG